MRTSQGLRPWIVLLALGLSVAPVGCREGDPLSADITPATPGFLPQAPSPEVTERFITLRANSIAGSRIVLDIVVHEVDEEVSGIVIKLGYPPSFSQFTGCFDGELFPPGECLWRELGSGSGEVLIERGVAGVEQAAVVEGERVIARLEFLVYGVAEGDLVFEKPNLGGDDASALLDRNGQPIWVEWYAGRLVGS